MMKNRIAISFAAALLCVVLMLAPGGAYAGRQELTAARERLFMEWDGYLAFRNEISSIQLWALDDLEQYLADNNWENLQQLQMAAAAGMSALRHIEAPRLNLDQDTREALKGYREELELVSLTVQGAALELDTLQLFFEELNDFAQSLYVFEPDHLAMRETAAFYRELLSKEMAYAANCTNKLFLEWDRKADWESVREKYPLFKVNSGEWIKARKTLETIADSLLDEMESLFYSHQSVTQYSDMMLDVMQRAAGGDYSELKRMIVLPQGLPAVFPYPIWAEKYSDICYYVYTEDGAKIRAVEPGDRLPLGLASLTFDRVTQEEFEAYYTYLKNWGYPGKMWDEEDGSKAMMVLDGDYAVSVVWNEAQTVLHRVDPAPCLIPAMAMEALLIE